MKIEICANSYESAFAAQEGGVHRIELCSDLSVGGLSPSKAQIEKVDNDLHIPVHVLIRPRDGDFCYSEKEITKMISTIEFCKETGCRGIVSGALTSNRNVDMEVIRKLIKASKGMHFTFHRAFDVVPHPLESIEQLKTLKINCLLSSGQELRAIDGLPLLNKMKVASEGIFDIMPGGGINVDHVKDFKNSGFNIIHLSAIKNRKMSNDEKAFFNSSYEGISDIETIREIVNQIT